MQRRSLTLSLIYLLFGALFSAYISAKPLNIYLWEDTLSPKVVSKWMRQTNQPVRLFHFDNDDERSLLMLKSVELPFDIVVLDNVSANIFSRQNTFEDVSNLENRKYLDPKWQQICGNNAIPYFWGTVGLLYRKDKFMSPPSWETIAKPSSELSGHIGLIEDSVETLLPALNALKFAPDTDSLPELKKAFEMTRSMNDAVLTYEYPLSYVRSHYDSSELYVAVGYSGDQHSLNRYFHQTAWSFTTPPGQPYVWVDCMAINSASKNKQQAREFLNYLMQPDVAAQNALDIGAATPNLAALDTLPNSYKQDTSIFVAPSRLKDAIVDTELTPQNLNIRAKIINNLVSQYEAKQ